MIARDLFRAAFQARPKSNHSHLAERLLCRVRVFCHREEEIDPSSVHGASREPSAPTPGIGCKPVAGDASRSAASLVPVPYVGCLTARRRTDLEASWSF
jgi:hypothetical protein